MSQQDEYLFYVLEGDAVAPPGDQLPGDCGLVHWRPGQFILRPSGFSLMPFGVWWLLHQLRVFANRGYALTAIYCGDKLVHRTCVFPRYFRFPFMAKGDLQIGDVWTSPSNRGQGLAEIAMRQAIGKAGILRGRWWYVVHSDNAASIRLAEKVGFRLHGRGVRSRRWGVGALGCYQITEHLHVNRSETLRAA